MTGQYYALPSCVTRAYRLVNNKAQRSSSAKTKAYRLVQNKESYGLAFVGLFWYPKDAILPFAGDKRWPDDTLFLVFEYDWRLFPDHANVGDIYDRLTET